MAKDPGEVFGAVSLRAVIATSATSTGEANWYRSQPQSIPLAADIPGAPERAEELHEGLIEAPEW
jgi:hypothetical protein